MIQVTITENGALLRQITVASSALKGDVVLKAVATTSPTGASSMSTSVLDTSEGLYKKWIMEITK